MAIGDKKPVVMESDLAVPGGVATLGKDGKLAEEQRPDYGVDQIEGLKEALERLADKETQDQIKQDTANIMETGWTILAELRGQRPKRYGYRVKISEPDPYSRVEYLFDAVGMTPAHMEFNNGDDGVFDYGNWKDIWFVRDNYACMVKNNGEEDYRLNPDNYALKAQDGTASDVSNMNYQGNAMSAIPLCWVNRYQEGGWQYVIFCEFQYDESYKAYAHTKADGSVAKYAYHACFKGSIKSGEAVSNGTLRSIAGDAVYPENNSTAEQELAMAKRNGAEWEIGTQSLRSLIADLLTLISKTTNSQAAFGQGNTTGYYKNGVSGDAYGADEHYGFCACGSLKDKGQFFGYGPGQTTKAVKVFHIENFWGNRLDRLVGLVLDNGTYKAKMTPEGNGYNLTGAGYTAVGPTISNAAAASGSGWQKETMQTEFGRLPIMPLEGSDATYETDYYGWNRTDVRVELAGGACHNGARCGARHLDLLSLASVANWSVGASLSLVGPS